MKKKKKIKKLKAKIKRMEYGHGQHELACQDLGIASNSNGPGDTLHEAICRLLQKLSDEGGGMYRLKMKDTEEPHYFTRSTLNPDRSIAAVNISISSQQFWVSKKKETAERVLLDIDGFYRKKGKANPFVIDKYTSE